MLECVCVCVRRHPLFMAGMYHPPPPYRRSKSALHFEMSHAIRITRLPTAGMAAWAWHPNQYTKEPFAREGGGGRGGEGRLRCCLLNSCQLQYIKTATRQGDKIPITQRIIVLLMCSPCMPRPILRQAEVLAAPCCPRLLSSFDGICNSAVPKDEWINRICIH